MEQLSIFDLTMPKVSVDKKIRLIELFAGVGSQAMALRDLGADFEHYRVVEFDKYAIASYNAIHGTSFEPMDITKITGQQLEIIDKEKYCYILTYSFPCQDLSAAGKGKGMKKGSGTRSGLLWEVERILKETKELPDILIMENVPQVIGWANMPDFRKWQDFLTELGYINFVDILNAKDYGVAQNRERCFMVSLLGEYNYHFPRPIPLDKTIKDYLEDEVDEKYYINTEKAQKLIETLKNTDIETEGGRWSTERSIAHDNAILQTASRPETGEYTRRNKPETSYVKEVGYIEKGTGKHQSNVVYSTDGIARCLQADGDSKNPLKVVVNESKTDR